MVTETLTKDDIRFLSACVEQVARTGMAFEDRLKSVRSKLEALLRSDTERKED